MAAGFPCVFGDDQHAASIIVTWLSTGATMALCDDDLAPALINLLAVDLGVDPTKFYDHVKRFVDKAVKAAASEAGKGTPDTDPGGAADGTGEPTPQLTGGDVLTAALAAYDAGTDTPAEVPE